MIAPKIRFPEFHDEYINDSLSEISDRVRRKNSENQTDIPLTIASIEGLVDQRTYFGKTVASKDMSGYYLLQNGEFAYNKSYSKGFPVGSIKRLDKYAQGALSTLYICFALKDDADVTSDYLVQYFNSPAWYEAVNEVCAEGARNHGLLNVSPDDFFATTHYFAPTKDEQDKVAAFLSLYDQKIENQMAKVEALELRRKGFLQQIFSQEIRFKADDGSEYEAWNELTIADLFAKVKVTNKDGKITNVITNSAVEGLIPQKDFFEKDIAVEGNTEKYTIIHKGDFVYNPRKSTSAPYGPFNCYRLDEPGIVSPLYSCLKPLNEQYTPYLLYYFASPAWYSYIYHNGNQGGARHDRVGMTDNLLMGIPVALPCMEEQEKISQFFAYIDIQIQIEKDKLEAIKLVKKGLLQQMFM